MPGRQLVYVGEGDQVRTRLAAHDADEAKEFFTRAVLIVSKDENLTKAHGRYLESRIIAAIGKAGRAKLVNGTEPPFKGLPEPEIADMERVLDEIEILLPVLGFDILRPAGHEAGAPARTEAGQHVAAPSAADPDALFTFTESGTDARAREASDEFVVLAGSLAKRQEVPSCSEGLKRRRAQLIADGILLPSEDAKLLRFATDTAFRLLLRRGGRRLWRQCQRQPLLEACRHGPYLWRLAQAADWRRGRGMSASPCLGDFFSNRQEAGRAGLPVMSVTMNDSLVLRDDLERRTESTLRPDQHLLVRKGDIAYNMMRMWQGACGLAKEDGIVSPAYVVLAPKPGIDSRFAYHWFKSARMIHLFWAYSHGLTEDRLRLYFDAFAEIPLTPPALEQQQRIVAVLDAWDQAIDQTERLIAAKRRRKTALLQKLFANLPKRPFLESADVWFSGVDKKSRADEAPVLLCNYMDVFHHSRITSNLDFMRATASRSQIVDNSLRKNDVVFTKDSETSEEIAEPALISEDIDNLVCGYHLAVARARDGVAHGPFIAQAMRHRAMRWQFSRLANGVVRFGLTLDAIEQAEIFLPSLPVQERIAAVLDAEDMELEGLTKQAETFRTQKRGLMQKLLTGEWRLDQRFDPQISTTQIFSEIA